ncbi:MAG TPA: DUF2066 domain-containing protein [Gammaproteobacteria bacterium]|nr:DUF2066 domain-containing protein [Gammaproteobacteria bacterium]
MKKSGLLFLLYLICASPVLAVRVQTLYQGVLPVSSQATTLQSQLASDALAQVLVKVSGNNAVLNNPVVKSQSGSAMSLMQEFGYAPAPHTPPNLKPWLLQVNFDPEGVNQLLRDAGQPIWGQNRPLLMVWLDYEVNGHPPAMIGADAGSDVSVMLKQQTDRRGLPVVFPAMDVTDLGQVSVNDIVTMALPKLMNAASRYTRDGMLIGRIQQTASGYNTQWKLVVGHDQWGWNITGNHLMDILASMSDHVADALAGRYATVISNTVQSEVTLKIVNVTEADDFVQVMNYIKHLTPVSDVEVVQITGNELILKVSLRGSDESFARALSVGQKMTPVATTGAPSDRVYQWNR